MLEGNVGVFPLIPYPALAKYNPQSNNVWILIDTARVM